MAASRIGATLLEILVVIAIVGVVGSLVVHVLGAPFAFARAAAHHVRVIRAQAIVEGDGVAVGASCPGSSRSSSFSEEGWLRVALPPRGLLFTADGLPRTCDGGGVGNTTILLEHRGHQAAVIVSSLGRVRWEPR